MVKYKIVQKRNHDRVYASGFYSLERAHAWLDNYNPRNWTDKTIMREDLEIILDTSY